MSYDYFKTPDPEEPKEVTWGDYGRAAAGGAAGIGAGSAGLMRQMFEAGSQPEVAQIFRGLQTASRNLGEDIEGGMTEEGRGRLAAGVTSEKFWEHPVSSLALKATGMSPYLVASVIPGALVGEGIAAMAAVGGTAGWLAAGDVVDEITKKPDKMSDADLRAQSPLYRDFRDGGDEEADARQKLNQIMVGAKPALAFVLGAGTGVLGPAGNVVRGLGQGARAGAAAAGEAAAAKGTGFLGQHGIKASAAEGALTEFAEEGYGGYAAQKAEIEAGMRQKYDQAEIFDRALTGAVLGGVLGGVTGIGAGRGKGKAKADEIREAQEQRRGEEGAAAQIPDRETGVAVPAEGAAPARRKTAKTKEITVDPAIEAALAAEQPAAPKAEPVVPVPQPAAAPAPAPAAAPVPVSPPPTPGAAQAQQAPIGPPTGPAAVTPEVTAPAAAPPASTPTRVRVVPERWGEIQGESIAGFDSMQGRVRLVDGSEIPVLNGGGAIWGPNRSLIDPRVVREFSEDGKAWYPVKHPPASVQPAIPTPEPSAAAQPATAPGLSTAEPSGVAPATTAPVVTPPTGRLLQDVSAEGAQRVADTTAAFQQAGEKGKKALAKAQRVAEGPKPRNRGKNEVASLAQRDEQAKAVYEAHREPLGDPFGEDVPVKREVREALALKIQSILDKAAEAGMVPRESLPDEVRIEKKGQTPEQKHQRNLSIPERAAGASPHVIYLRELIGVQQALRSKKFGPASDERARVNQFLTEHNIGDLQSLADRRLEVGRTKKAKRGSAVAATPGKKDVQSEGAAATRELTEEQQEAIAKQMGVPFKPKPKGPEVVTAAREKGKPTRAEIDQEAKDLAAEYNAIHGKITEESRETKPEPVAETQQEVTPEVTAPPAGMSEKARHAALRKWMTLDQINALSVKDQIAFLKDPPPLPTAPVKAPPARPKRTEAEIEAEERARENAERVEEIEREEAREREVREELARENAAKEKARPAATQAASAEELAALAPKPSRAPVVVKKKPPGLLRMSDDQAKRSRVVEFTGDDDTIWDSPLHKARDLFGHDEGSIGFSGNTSEVLRNLDLAHLEGEAWAVPKYVIDFTRRRLTELLGDTKIHFASANLIQDATGDANVPFGYFHPSFGARRGYIVVRAGMSPAQTAHVVMHEALHAALYYRINANPALRKSIEALMARLDESTKGRIGGKQYARRALVDVHEFISEALSNPKLQQQMMNITVTPDGGFGMKPQTLWTRFVDKVRGMMGLPAGAHNMLSEALRLVSPELERAQSEAVKYGTYQAYGSAEPLRLTSMDALQDAAIGRLADTKINTGAKLAQYKRAVSTAWDLSGRGEHSALFGPSNPLNRLFDLGAKMARAGSAILDKYGGAKSVNALAQAERAHPEAMVKAKAMLFDLSLHDINPEGDNAHLGKDKLMGVQAKNEIARLKAAWNDPALDPVRDTIRNAAKFFKDIHNAVSRATIKNIFAEANIHDEALVDRIHQDGLTEADEEAWANTKLLSALNQVRGLKKRQGWYVPFRRYGDYISAAEHELSVPANALQINDNTLQFIDPTGKGGNARARAQVKTYLRSNSHTPQGDKLTPAQIRKVWVDKNDPSQIVEAEDQDAIPAYRVSMQTQHMEMHETEADAQNSQADLKAAGLLHSRSHKREEAYRTDVTNIQSSMGAVLRSLEKQQRYIDADSSQKAAMREMFHDLTLGLSGTTSIKNSMRQRRNVAGESRDLGRVTADYAQMTANHLAMLEYRPQIDAVFKEMRAYEKEHEHDKDAIRREEVRKEFQDRIYGKAGEEANKNRSGAITRALQLTRLSFLAGPSFHLINAHEPWTTSLPYIGGRHGFGAALKTMTDAYSLIGGRTAVVSGFKDTVKAYTDDSGFTDYVKLFKDTIDKNKTVGGDLARRLKDMIDYADARNLYSNASMFEMAKYADPTGNIAGRALDRADLMANQVGSAIEAINRTVTLLPAYKLEYRKNGGNHEAAMHYAYSAAMNTMGDYSAWNAAPIFNTKYGRLALQFKKFPQKTYMLLGNIVGGITRGDPQAMKQFAGLMVTHGLVAGALGMPTEPFKLALLAANAVGATGFTPEDYDYAVRQLMAKLAGQKGGEILSKGLYRGIGIEVSGRMGYDSLLLRGQPKSQKDADLKTFLFDTMAGAPASYMLNQIQGAQAAFKGDFATAVEKMSPLRTVGDITKAIVGATGDKKGPSGKTTQEQFTAWEAVVRALGFQPASAYEQGAVRGTQARLSKRLSADRSELINDWIDASGAKKVDAQRAVQAFNIGRPTDEQITQKDLTNAARRRERDKKVTQHGITTSKRTRAIDEQILSTFNP